MFNAVTNIGFSIMLIAIIAMVVLAIINQPIPAFLAWSFFIGMVIAIASAFVMRKDRAILE